MVGSLGCARKADRSDEICGDAFPSLIEHETDSPTDFRKTDRNNLW